MKLFIEIDNNNPKGHPAFEQNLIQAFGKIPENWVPFERLPLPQLDTYEILESEYSEYRYIDGVYKDVWNVRTMNEQEKSELQELVKTRWNSLPNIENFTAWIFDDSSCSYVPPIPEPTGGLYRWNGNINNWEEISV
jgi:hypothetical protein